ncbi:MAG: double-strand break repair protein AddB [Proteobacteria bacterium]|nr:double-strand break repair protein AddB [Pseudomonadota bacterium]
MSRRGESWRQLAAAKPAVFTIPARLAFVDVLARGILADAGDDPLALTRITVLLPTRRACRALREAFLRLSGGTPVLLPRMMPLNDLDEEDALFSGFASAETLVAIPPAIAPLKRQLFLARLIQSRKVAGRAPHLEEALHLAAELARLIDQVQTEQLDFARLKNLVPDAYAEHWKETLAFLEIVTQLWPNVLKEDGTLDPVEHRNRVFAAQAAAWTAHAPGPVIAAGSTGSVPATADLLLAIANLPEGCVVLPGLDQTLDDAGWDALDETHPQYGMKELLGRLGLAREHVRPWPDTKGAETPRETLVTETMRPAETTESWRALAGVGEDAIAALARVDCPGAREEAEVISFIMREALETPERTCALVTPDRRLAERVGAELKRWKIDIDDSAGRSLDRTPVGTFLRLTAAMVAEEFAPVATLAACKHPLAAAGLDEIVFRTGTRAAERFMLRGPRPAAGLEGLKGLAGTLTHHQRDITPWMGRLEICFKAFADVMAKEDVALDEVLNAHMEAAEAFAETPERPGPLRLWAGDDGEALAAFAAELAQYGAYVPRFAPRLYPAVLNALLTGQVVRPKFGKHPRLAILGPLEARLQRFDVLILSGLNEGTWPGDAPADPWMSRPMRAAFGLPSPERRVGLAAHDVAQALCAPRVIMTRAVKADGTPTVPSRWLMRLEQVIKAAGLTDTWRAANAPWLAWAKELSHPAQFTAAKPPAPRPPVAARPRKLSVTQIETWMRDPYGIYARCVLGLEALPELDQDASLADYGSLTHKALQDFITAYPSGELPKDAQEQLCAIGKRLFDTGTVRPAVMAFWWPRFERIAAWFVKHEQSRRDVLKRAHVERGGKMVLDGPAGPFTLTAKADRIDETSNGLVVIDYKTGAVPTDKMVNAGYSPQLPLEAAMALAGAFAGVPRAAVDEIAFWALHGRKEGGNANAVKGDAAELAKAAHEGLARLIAAFDDPNTPYEARPNPETAPAYSDYLHLARVKEWISAGEDDA